MMAAVTRLTSSTCGQSKAWSSLLLWVKWEDCWFKTGQEAVAGLNSRGLKYAAHEAYFQPVADQLGSKCKERQAVP